MTPRSADARWPSFVLAALIAAATVFLLGGMIDQLVDKGPFGWHLGRERTWQGGLEVLALAALMAAAAGWIAAPRWRALVLVVLGESYLRRHYVDLPILFDVVYFEILVGLGAGLARLCGLARANDVRGYLGYAVAGIALWSLGAWTLSAFGFGSLKILRVYTLLLALPAFAARQKPFCLFLWGRFASLVRAQRAAVAALAAWFLCLAARTNIVSGFDAWWYGLRGDYVLVPGGSAFESLDLVAPVNYYPKLYELLLIPLSGLGDTSVIEGISIVVLALFALTCMELLRAFALGFGTRLLLTALCVTVPAIANAALSPKADLFAAWLLLLGCLDAARFAREGTSSALLGVVTVCALALASKLSAPPYIAAIVLAMLFVWWRNGRPRDREDGASRRCAQAVAIAAVLAAALATARTWILAGIPLVGPQPLVELFAHLGMTLKPTVGLLVGGPPVDWADTPALLADQLFRPQRLAHMVITWIGNVWLYLFALALVAQLLSRRTRTDRPGVPAIWSVVLLTGLVLLATFRTIERGGDGNYFVLPVALAIMVGGYAALKRLPPDMPARILLATLPLFVLFQATYSFVSAGWSAGTRPFDFDFTHGVRDLRDQNRKIFSAAGISGIADYLRAVPGIARGVGYVADSPAFRLPATFETLNFYEYWQRNAIASPDAFIDYLAAHRIDYLVLPKPGTNPLKRDMVAAILDAGLKLRSTPDVRVIEDAKYDLYDLAALHARERATR